MKLWKPLVGTAMAALGAYTVYDNTHLDVTHYTVQSDRLPLAFSSLKIGHISDLHNTEIPCIRHRLMDALAVEMPDLIVVTGDLIDCRHTNSKIAMKTMRRICEIAPVYYVAGNHEAKMQHKLPIWEAQLTAMGVEILKDRAIPYEKDGETVYLCGIYDPAFVLGSGKHSKEAYAKLLEKKLQQVLPPEGFRILLSHRPCPFETYQESGVELVLCGHAHGGMIRLPGKQGVISPDEGFFPKYTQGVFQQEGTSMVVSRGIGNSLFPLRFHNASELVMVTLESTKPSEA